MDIGVFTEDCKRNSYADDDIDKFLKAAEFAKERLFDKKRISGDSYYTHNLRVGQILVNNRSRPEVVVAGILHGIIADKDKKEILNLFGDDVLNLILEVEEVQKIKSQNNKMEADALRKIILSTLNDVRVILIKLANKLDNLRTANVLPENEQKRIAQEVLEVYAPLAYRLGLERMKVPLEDLALKIIHPQDYKKINDFLEESQEEREKSITEAIKLIKKEVQDEVSLLKIKGRPKHLYSIYRKIKEKKIGLKDLFDLLGLRIIVPEIKDCYSLLGLLHQKFEPIPGRLKDYIANPKTNFYRSIHTGIKLPTGKIAEIQIRTPEMDEIAEEGIASHWRYKGLSSEQLFEKKVSWLRGILEMQLDAKEKEFLEAAKVDVFGDKVYCYTPKGQLKELPTGSTVLDFAYAVHEHIGNTSVGARVNGKFVPLRHKLVHGDIVEILTNKNQRPRRTWIKIVKSSKAKQKIRKSLKEYEKLPALFYRTFKPETAEQTGILAESEEFPKAVCILAKCCHPLPGEEIVGIVTKRKIISVHQEECNTAKKLSERWVPVNWKETFSQKIKFYVLADERRGLLADLLHNIANVGFEVKEAKAKMFDVQYVECSFLVVPKDLEHVIELIKRVKKVKGIKKVYFD